AMLDELRAEGHRVLAAAGADLGHVRFRYGVDARYAGQGNEVTVWVGEGDAWTLADSDVLAAFEAEYRRIFGMAIPDVAVEIVTWRLSVASQGDAIEPDPLEPGTGATPIGTRHVVFGRAQAPIDTPVYHRPDLGA